MSSKAGHPPPTPLSAGGHVLSAVWLIRSTSSCQPQIVTKVSCPLWIKLWRLAPRCPCHRPRHGAFNLRHPSAFLSVRPSSRHWVVEVHVGQRIKTVIFGQTWREGRFLMPPATVLAIPKASWPRPLWLTTESRLLCPAPAKTPTCSPFLGCGR